MSDQNTSPRLEAFVDESKYHAGKELSKSSLDLFRLSPHRYWEVFRSGNAPERTETQAFRDGSTIHAAVLEPDVFAASYIASKYKDKRSKAWKEAVAKAEESGKILLSAPEVELAKNVLTKIAGHPEAARLLLSGDGVAELSAYAHDPETGLPIRGRFDYFRQEDDGSVHIVDLKTTIDASPKGFAKSVRQYGYHRQEAMYRKLASLCCPGRPVKFTFVVVEKSWPFSVGIYTLSEGDVQRGADEIRDALVEFKRCHEEDDWPLYGNGASHEITAFNF